MHKIKFNRFDTCLILFKKIIKISIIVFLMTALVECNPDIHPKSATQNVDKSFTDCKQPCWYGLALNRSTKEEVVSTLSTLPFVEHDTQREYITSWKPDTPAVAIYFICESDHKSVCLGVIISDNILRSISTNLEYDLSLKDAVNKLGTPEFVDYEWPSMSGVCNVSVIWVTLGMTARIYDDNNYNECESIIDGKKISPNIAIESIIYFSIEDFGESPECCHRVAWPGFKEE